MITLTDRQLAEIIGKEPSNNDKIYWSSQDLAQVKIALRALQMTARDEDFLIDSVMPYWLYLGILAALSPKTVMLNTPNFGPLQIPANASEGAGKGLPFHIFEDSEFTLVQFSSPRHLQPEQLKSIVPPAVNPTKGVVISSNAPPWIIATVGLAYAKTSAWVACTQKFGAAVVAISNDKATPLGTEIDRQKVQVVQEKATQAAVPKRGEVWLFDDGYGEHPGVILSPEIRNKRASDVLLVPLTSSVKHAHRHLAVARAGTGLAIDSFAQCSNISRVGKEQLLRGPLSVITDDLLVEVMRHVRLALGDAA